MYNFYYLESDWNLPNLIGIFAMLSIFLNFLNLSNLWNPTRIVEIPTESLDSRVKRSSYSYLALTLGGWPGGMLERGALKVELGFQHEAILEIAETRSAKGKIGGWSSKRVGARSAIYPWPLFTLIRHTRYSFRRYYIHPDHTVTHEAE